MKKLVPSFLLGLLCSLMLILPVQVFAASEPAGKVTEIKQTGATVDSVKFTYVGLLDADVKYEFRISTAVDGSYTAWGTSDSRTEGELKNLPDSGQDYYMKVVPFRESGEGELLTRTYGSASEVFQIVTAPDMSKLKVYKDSCDSSSVTISWDKVGSVDGYYIRYQRADGEGSTERVETDQTSIKIKGLLHDTSYYFTVSAYRKSDSGYKANDWQNGGTSATFSVRRAIPEGVVTDIRQTACTETSIDITYKALLDKDALYEVFISVWPDRDFISWTTTNSSNTCSLTNLPVGGNTYYIKIVPYYSYTNDKTGVEERNYGTESAAVAVATKTPVVAPSAMVTGLTQIGAGADSVTLSFTGLPDVDVKYAAWVSDSFGGPFVENAISSGTTLSLSGLKNAGSNYYVTVFACRQSVDPLTGAISYVYGLPSEIIEVTTAPGSKPKKVKQSGATENSISITWDAVSGATGYLVEYSRTDNTKEKTQAYVTGNKYTANGLDADAEYSFYVTPYRMTSTGFVACDYTNYTAINNVPVKPGKAKNPVINRYWKSLDKINVATGEITCADGYQYELWSASDDKSVKLATKNVTSYSSADIIHAQLGNDRVFKVRVRAYINVNGKKIYGAWSGWTYTANAPEATLSSEAKGVKVSWDKVEGADRYLVYVSAKKNGTYTKCVTTTATTATVTKISGAALKKGSTYYVYILPQKKVAEKYVTVGKKADVASIRY